MRPAPLEEIAVAKAFYFTLPETHQLRRDSVRRFEESEIAPMVPASSTERQYFALIGEGASEI